MIIFGWGKKTVKDYGDTLPLECGNCNNKVYYKLVTVTTWFTLFFVPIIPYDTKNLLMCGICKAGIELTREKFERAKTLAQQTIAFKNNEISNEEYKRRIEETNLFGDEILGRDLLMKRFLKKKRRLRF